MSDDIMMSKSFFVGFVVWVFLDWFVESDVVDERFVVWENCRKVERKERR